MSQADAAYAYLRALAAGLAACGVRDVCVCPGSRSTPVALALASQPALHAWMHLDERSAAYFALGVAKGSHRPVAVVCTSGTAVANLLPATVEAYHAGVPLLLLTADRPPEVRGWGAAQTIDQVKLFSGHVKWFADPGVPGGAEGAASLARRAVAVATAPFAGPVHINLPLREPLVPSVVDADPVVPSPAPLPHDAPELPPLPATERGIIIAGGMDAPAPAITELAAATGWPVLADPLSQLRCGPHHSSLVLDSYDACLRESGFASSMLPDIVVRFGAPPTSKALGEWARAARRQIVVDPGWRDPDLRAEVWPHDPNAVALALCAGARPVAGGYAARWQRADAAARGVIAPGDGDHLTEMGIFPCLAEALPDGSALLAGNSMPVRDMDSFLPGMEKTLRVLSNRGANGIDGVVSTALGVAAVAPPAALVVGDISFYHDMNGLLAAKRYAPDLLIVVVQNDGGGIFSYLSQASLSQDTFEPLFGTPHGLDFAHAAALYGLPHRRVETWQDFRGAVTAWRAGGGTHMVEVPSDRARSLAEHRSVWAAAAEAVRACG